MLNSSPFTVVFYSYLHWEYEKLFEMRHNEVDTYLLGLEYSSSYSYAIIIEASTISAYNQQKT